MSLPGALVWWGSITLAASCNSILSTTPLWSCHPGRDLGMPNLLRETTLHGRDHFKTRKAIPVHGQDSYLVGTEKPAIDSPLLYRLS